MKGARRCESAFFLSTKSAESITDNNNEENRRNAKRAREQPEIPTITVENVPTTSAQNSTTTTMPTAEIQEQTLNGNRAAVILDRLYDKIDRYNSHNEFLRKCTPDNVIPTSYKIILEPSIGNHDEKFLKGYYGMLETFSKQVMEYTADYCKEKITIFESQQETSEKDLSESTPREVFLQLKKTLTINQDKRKKVLKETKDRKFIRLKYQSKQTNKQLPHNEASLNQGFVSQQSYAQAAKRKKK